MMAPGCISWSKARNHITGGTMNRNLLYAVIGALVVIVGILGYRYYQASQTTGISIEMNDSGISIEGN
jgi:hypothetical protein